MEHNLLAMPAEVTTKIFSLAVGPSQLPDFSPEYDFPAEVYENGGHFCMDFRTVNKHFSKKVMQIVKDEILWVKVSILHPRGVSPDAEAQIAYLKEDQMCFEEDSFGGSIRPFLTITFGYKIGEHPPGTTIHKSFLCESSPRPFNVLCQNLHEIVYTNRAAMKFLNIENEIHPLLPHVGTRVFGFLILIQGLSNVTIHRLADAKLRSIVQRRIESPFELTKDVIIYSRYYMRRGKVAQEVGRLEEAVLQYETGVGINAKFRPELVLHPDNKASNLALDLACQLCSLAVGTTNAMSRPDVLMDSLLERLLANSIKYWCTQNSSKFTMVCQTTCEHNITTTMA